MQKKAKSIIDLETRFFDKMIQKRKKTKKNFYFFSILKRISTPQG